MGIVHASASMLVIATQDLPVELPVAQVASPVRPVTALERKAIASAVSDQLKDPEAAHFRWVPNISINGRYCGLVNGKNGYGGYVGYTPFQASVSYGADGAITVTNVSIAMDANISEAIKSGCALVGLDLSSATAE